MAKLQLYINKSLRGYKNLVNINPEEDVIRHIHDYRHALSALDYDNSRVNVFYLLTYLENGLLLTALSTIAGSGQPDHTAASLFLPLGIEVDDNELLELLRSIVSAIDTGAADLSSTAVSTLRELLSKDYPFDPAAPARIPSSASASVYAHAYYGGARLSLADYAKAKFYVPAYTDFAGVLLVDADSGATGRDEQTDLSCTTLPRTTTLLPPKRTREGFTPHIYHRAFTRPIVVPVDTDLEIQWKRGGFDHVVQTLRVGEGVQATVPTPDTSKAGKTITPASFFITEQGSQRSIGSFMIKVNGIDIEAPHTFTYAELHDAKVEISSPGYFAFSGNLDLASSTQALVQMKLLHRTYRFDLPLHTPEPVEAIRIYLKTKRPIVECPIEGYEVAGGEIVEGTGVSNNLVYVGGRSRRLLHQAIAGAVIIFLLGIFVGWLAFSVDESERQAIPQPTEVTEIQPQPESKPADEPEIDCTHTAATKAPVDFSNALVYLDSNKRWARADMENIPELRGFYDDLNNYRFDRIRDYWAPALSQSTAFTAVLKSIDGASSAAKRNPATAPHAPAFNNNGEDAIHWRSYTFWVDP